MIDGRQIIQALNNTSYESAFALYQIEERKRVEKAIAERKKTMNKNKYKRSNYLKELLNVKEASDELESLYSAIDELKKDYETKARSGNLSDKGKLQAQAEFYEQREKINKQIREISEKANASIKDIQTRFDSMIDEVYMPKGEDLDTDTVNLLNSGIKLTPDELTRLSDKYEGNRTMQRLLLNYSNAQGLDHRTIKMRAVSDKGRMEKEQFSDCANVVSRCFSEHSYSRTTGRKFLPNLEELTKKQEEMEGQEE